MSRRPSIIGTLGVAPEGSAPAEAPRPKAKGPDIVHTSIYVPKAAYRKLQEIALVQERKVHDIIMDGIDTVLGQHGHAPTERRKRGAKGAQ
jgi:hypothetical protein